MAPPLYFLPNVTTDRLLVDAALSRDILDPLGLADTFADVIDTGRDDCYIEELRGSGPDDKPGTLLMAHRADHEISPRVGYFPKGGFQTWTRFARDDREFYLGTDSAHPSTPDDLARKEQLPGYLVTIDGQDWAIPVIRTREGQSGLPQDWIPDLYGNVTTQVKQAYRQLWEDFAAVVDLFYPAEDIDDPAALFDLDPTSATRHCVRALSLNYRFGFAEQAALRVIDSRSFASILIVCIDYRTLRAVVDHATTTDPQKKSEHADPATNSALADTSPGDPAASPATPQAAPNST